MKTFPFLLLLLSCLNYSGLLAQTEVITFSAQPNGMVSLDGKLSQGQLMPDLSWAWSSQNACFVATQQQKFTGNHVLYRTEIPPRSEMTIRVVPKDKNADFSLYAYSGGGGAIVPDLPSCVSCEADYKWDFKYRGKSQDHTRSVQLRAISNPYPVTIGVVGARGLTTGDFTLEVELNGGEAPTPKAQAEIPVLRAESKKGSSLSYSGNLREGVFVNQLDWAWSSQNACFPATRQDQFQGHHQLYVTALPEHSELTITLVPEDPEARLNLYAYSLGNELQLVPDLKSCVSCEAGYSPRAGLDPNVRQVQLRAVNHPYQVVIGIAGARGITEGAYTLQLDLK